ncbi:MAG TPA: asparaginase [Amycolatopsis sp.]|nr:asparaginase [Amycolatopsis sp.]
MPRAGARTSETHAGVSAAAAGTRFRSTSGIVASGTDRTRRPGAAPGGHSQRLAHHCIRQARRDARHPSRAQLVLGTHLDRDHPLQVAVRETVADLTGQRSSRVAVDGCGAPFALSLRCREACRRSPGRPDTLSRKGSGSTRTSSPARAAT